NENPPADPRPGMGGGRNANTFASGISALNRALIFAISDFASIPFPSRLSHGSSATNAKPLYVADTYARRLKPPIVVYAFTPFVWPRMFSILRQTRSVRC